MTEDLSTRLEAAEREREELRAALVETHADLRERETAAKRVAYHELFNARKALEARIEALPSFASLGALVERLVQQRMAKVVENTVDDGYGTENVPAEEDMLRLREVEHELGVSRDTLLRWIKSGKLEAIRVGPQQWRVRTSVVEAMKGKRRKT